MVAEMQLIQHTYRDGYTGALRWWSGQGKGVVLYFHGIQSHGLWFETSAGAMADSGFSVCLPDRRGSGLNEDSRGHVEHYRRWIDDQVELIDWIGEKTGIKRVHLVGVSWGGKLAMAIARVAPEKIASLTMIAPGIFPAVDVSFGMKLQIAVAVIARSSKRFPIPLNDPELFTSNPERQAFIQQDRLRLNEVTGNFLYQSRRLDNFVRRVPERLTMPMKLFLAGHERIIDNQATLRYYRSLRAAGPKTLAYFPEANHTLEFEKNNQPFITQLLEWLNHANNI